MPSIAAHVTVSKLVSNLLEINDINFEKGNLLPDFVLDENSHFKKQSEIFQVPDLKYFKENYDLSDMTTLGYYTHLLLDYYFLEDYCMQIIKDPIVFQNGIIYKEYSCINNDIITGFDINVEKYNQILRDFLKCENMNTKKIKLNIKSLNTKVSSKTNFLKPKEFMSFLDEISYVISEEVKEYASKPNQLSLRLRKKEE